MPRKGGTSTPPVQDILDCSSSSESLYFDESDRLSPPFAPPTKDQKQQQQQNYANEEQYDLTSLKESDMRGPRSYTLDPFEFAGGDVIVMHDGSRRFVHHGNNNNNNKDDSSLESGSPYQDNNRINTPSSHRRHAYGASPDPTTFIIPEDIHPQMENNQDDIQRLRLLAGRYWTGTELAPALARRIRDFQFAQEKRRKKYGDERPWGILGVYDHLSSIRIDVAWAEDAAQRRANGEPYQSWADFDAQTKTGRNRPYCTYVLLVVCSGIMVASLAVNGWTVESLDVNPMVGPSADTLILMGAKEATQIVNELEWWRLLTSSLLHAGLVHYVINMLALWFVGPAIEMSHGWFAALLIFGLSALGGSILSALFLPEAISVGASGGIFGFIGACLADIIMNWRLLFCDVVIENGTKHRHVIVVVVLLFDIALNSIIGLTPYIDNYNHLGGMMYGFLCGLTTMNRLSVDFFGIEESWMNHAKQFVTRFFGVFFSIASIVVTLVILMNGDATTTPCPGCTWLSCVPFPPWEPKDNKWWYCDDCGRITADLVTVPSLHLELNCPSGNIAEIALDPDESKFDRDRVQKHLPTYCRQYCPSASGLN